ncbi:hypothetical protein [Mucilaginibacter sp.]
MVKIRKGYVMSPQERLHFEHMDALPRKAYGQVESNDKPQTVYPPRSYVFIHTEIWKH